MRGLYQIPGLILTALCHVIVIYHISEHKYTRKKFIFYACLYAVCFVSLMGYGFTAGGIITLISYIGIVLCTFLFSCIVSWECFFKKCFLVITYFCLFSVLDNILRIMVELLLQQISESAGYYTVIVLRSVVLLLILVLYKKYVVVILRSLADISRSRWWNLALIALLFYLLQAALSVLNVLTVMPKVHLLFDTC